jgi:hypothetical protein
MFQGEKTMRKLIISTIALTSLLAVSSVANAGYWLNGVYYPWCFWNWLGQYVCY